MSMKEDSNVKMVALKATQSEERSCGGAMEQKKRKYRRLRSKSTNKIIHQKKERPRVPKVFDPTAWYVVQVKRHKEVDSRDFLNTPQGFINESTMEPYTVEAYAAIQEEEDNRLVIHGKIFVRVAEVNRIDVLRKCMFLKGYVKDPARELTQHDFTDFARVPDREIRALREILEIADGAVEYSEVPFKINDSVKITKGILSRSEFLKDQKCSVELVNGKKRATVILDSLGVFKFNISLSQLRKT